ncbi:MAG TPA: hypothetical protein VGB52_15290 [Actinomycetota bacterium]|jgi:hypothetical protein
MTASRGPLIAQRCPVPLDPEEERHLREQLARLRADIEVAGGLFGWIETRLEDWLFEAEVDSPAPHPMRARRT